MRPIDVARTAFAIAAVYSTVAIVARFAFRRILFPAPRTSGDCPVDARLVTLRAFDGATVNAFEVGAGPRALVYLHGNGETAADAVPLARLLADAGYRVFVLEYRGYGISANVGVPTEAGLYADAEALLTHVTLQGPVAVWGTSLGTGVALEMTRRFAIRSLVLASPFTSVRDVCKHHAPFLPSGFIVRDAFDSLAQAGAVRVPTLILHGEADRLIPSRMGRALASRIAGARYVGFETANHAIFSTHGDAVVREALSHLAR